MKKVSFLCLLILTQVVRGQNQLSIQQFLAIVRQYHPVVKLATINVDKSLADVQIAKGAFNPLVHTYAGAKTFNQTNYYQQLNPELSIPTWFGADIDLGIQNLEGERTNTDQTLGQTGYVSITMPVVKNLLLDKRRAMQKQAMVFTNLAKAEQALTINDLMKEAVEQYWQWVGAYGMLQTMEKNELIARQRLEFVKQAVIHGERPLIDTVEAVTQYQNMLFQKNESYLFFLNQGLLMSTYMWTDQNQPYQLPSNIIPATEEQNNIEVAHLKMDLKELQRAAESHPALLMYDQKNTSLQIEQKLKYQELLPGLDINYTFLGKNYLGFGSESLLFKNNYRFGLKFSMPIFFTSGRGEYTKSTLKLNENKTASALKRNEILNKLTIYFNENLYYQNQLKIQEQTLLNFEKLLKAEEQLLMNGESSLFLINARENKVLETQRKLIEYKVYYFKSLYAVHWAAGILN